MAVFDVIARYYDLEHEDYQEDIDLYKNFAISTSQPILELACGTGRVLIPLARAGFNVTGLDNSAEMLAIARGKIDRDSESRIMLVQADMEDFHLEGRYGLAIVPLDGFMHLESLPAQARSLQSIARHLVAGGVLIVDLFNPLGTSAQGENGELILHWVKPDPATGHQVAKLISSTLDQTSQKKQITLLYDDVDESGNLKRSMSSFGLRYLFRYEMQLLLEKCGFFVDNVYGSYDLDEYDADSERMIFVTSRRK